MKIRFHVYFKFIYSFKLSCRFGIDWDPVSGIDSFLISDISESLPVCILESIGFPWLRTYHCSDPPEKVFFPAFPILSSVIVCHPTNSTHYFSLICGIIVKILETNVSDFPRFCSNCWAGSQYQSCACKIFKPISQFQNLNYDTQQ
jgi:hypothetical protein